MALKAVIENLDDVAEDLRAEYKETVDPKTKAKVFVLDLEGFDSLPSVRKLKDENGQHRIAARDANALVAKFKAFGEPDEVLAKLDKLPELEAAAEGKLDDAKINTIVETRVKTKLAPLERELGQAKTRVTELEGVNSQLTQAEVRRKVTGAVGRAARDLKVLDSATEDVELYAERLFEVDTDGNVVTKDNVGVNPGLSPKAWLEDMQAKRPHWWPATSGGGAGGGKGGAGFANNPWSGEHWNMTEQGNVMKADRARAERMAKAAGVPMVGGVRPKVTSK